MRFYETKDIFLEFRVSKETQTKPDEFRREQRRDRNQLNQSVEQSMMQRAHDADCEEENDQRMEFIYAESNFNFIMMHLITHLHDHIYQFGNIHMYSTGFGELAHKEQIKDGW